MGVEKKNGVKKRSANAQNRLHKYDKGFYNVERIFLSIEKNIRSKIVSLREVFSSL